MQVQAQFKDAHPRVASKGSSASSRTKLWRVRKVPVHNHHRLPLHRLRPQSELQTGFREWTFLIPRQNTRFQVVEIGKFFKLGWELISKEDTETGQQIIKKLASEEGLAMIKALADENVDGIELEKRMRIFKRIARFPFSKQSLTRTFCRP